MAAAAARVIREALSLDVKFNSTNNTACSYYYKGGLVSLEDYHRLVRQDAAKHGFAVVDFQLQHVGVGTFKVGSDRAAARGGQFASAATITSLAYQTSHRIVPNLAPASAL
jgi:hypothetical protein